MRYFLELSYMGTAYHGWQIQANAVTVQGVIGEALCRLLGSKTALTGAGRTDTGVHASYYVAHFDTAANIYENDREREEFVYHLNAILPGDIAVKSVAAVAESAHARFDAVSREYTYFIIPFKDPFRRLTAWLYRGQLDTEAMNAAAERLLVYDDFTTFCKLHSSNMTNICRVNQARWETMPDGTLVFTIRSDRFLRNMVRSLVGTLVDVGRGKTTVEGFEAALAARDLSLAGNTAPAEGLFLSDIKYPEEKFQRQR